MPTLTACEANEAKLVAHNLRRLMSRNSLRYDDLIGDTGLDKRTLHGIALGKSKPQARTLHRLADCLGVTPDEFFVDAATIDTAGFDRATNPVVSQVIHARADLFEGWTSHDFAELYSRFGQGGELTRQGTIAAAEKMNAKRQVLQRANIVLESADGDLLAEFVEMLYQRNQPAELQKLRPSKLGRTSRNRASPA